ncbi:MAG: autotransporter-associated beta strand repeat-containing protein, partial [Verrucomicrobiales bacterium]|nr:autotransporter-associated beta strand repeat-containing protein [Verrucomicrobiales bacterium]
FRDNRTHTVFELAGAAANTYAGDTHVDGATLLLLNKAATNGAIPGPLIIGDSFDSGATVRLLRAQQIAAADVFIGPTSLLDLDGFDDTIGALFLLGGAVQTGGGTLLLGGNLTAMASDRTANISGRLSFGTEPRDVLVARGSVSPDLRITAQIVGGHGFVKEGQGQLLLTGLNTYIGQTTINNGLLWIASPTSGLGRTASPAILNAGTLRLENATVDGKTLIMNGPNARLESAFNSSWTGDIALAPDTTIAVDNGLLDLSGLISGSGDLIKEGEGTLLFSGDRLNTFAGDLFAQAGIVRLEKDARPAFVGTIHIGDGVGTDVVLYGAPDQARRAIVNGSGLLDLNGFDDFLFGLVLNGGGDVSTARARWASRPITVSRWRLARAAPIRRSSRAAWNSPPASP